MKINGNPDGGGGGGVITGLSITENGIYTAGGGIDGFSPVDVDVQPSLQDKTISINGSYTADEGYYGFSTVTVDVQPSLQSKSTSINGTITPDEGYYGLSAVEVNVPDIPAVTESLTVSVNNTYYPGSGVDGFSQVVVDVPQSVTGFTEKEITEASVPVTNLNNSASYVGAYAFKNNNTIQTVYLPDCVSTYDSAFNSCTNLTEVYMPNCIIIGPATFGSCVNLQSISFPACVSANDYAFYSCTNLTEVYMPNCIVIGYATFVSCVNLQSISFPACRYISGYYAFNGCVKLESVSLPNCSSIGNEAFRGCSTISIVNLPVCRLISSYAFAGASNIESLNMPLIYQLNMSVFDGNNNFKISSLDFPHLRYAYSNAFNMFKSVRTINFPIINTMSAYISNGYLEELSYGNRTYRIPSLPNAFSTMTSGSIYVDAYMYDSWVAHSQWGSLSSLFVSFGDPTVPMLSFSNGVLYGKTWHIDDTYSSYLNINSNQVTELNLPECIEMNYNYFCPQKITSVSLPNCEVIDYYAFNGCGSLYTLSLPKCKLIGGNAIRACYNLHSLILKNSEVCYLYPYGLADLHWSTLSIYVPQSLVDSYKTSINWSSLSSRIFPILPDLSYSDGLVYGWATSMDSTYLTSLGITAGDVTGVSMSYLNDVASSTFMNHSNLVSLSIPGVTEYKDDTFNGCSALTTIDLGVSALGDRVFANCTSLETVDIAYIGGVISVGSDIFSGCTALTTINVPATIYNDYLSASGWSEYSSLMVMGALPELSFKNGLIVGSASYISSASITNTLGVAKTAVTSAYLPDCITLGSGTFTDCTNLTSASLENVRFAKEILNGSGVFQNCTNLSSIYLPRCLEISGVAFIGCTNCSEINLPHCTDVISGACIIDNGTTTVKLPMVSHLGIWYGNTVLCRCSTLSQVYLATDWYGVPSNHYYDEFASTPLASGIGSIYVNHQNYSLFTTQAPWSKYASLYVSVGDPTVPMLSFENGVLSGATKVIFSGFGSYVTGIGNANSITSISLPNCEVVGPNAFMSCNNLTDIELPNCTDIMQSGLGECHYLANISLPNCEYLGTSALVGVGQSTSGTNIVLPKVKYIGAYAFFWNTKLQTLTLGASSVCVLENTNAFNVTDSLQSIYVPTSLVDSYKTAKNWSNFASMIFPIE